MNTTRRKHFTNWSCPSVWCWRFGHTDASGVVSLATRALFNQHPVCSLSFSSKSITASIAQECRTPRFLISWWILYSWRILQPCVYPVLPGFCQDEQCTYWYIVLAFATLFVETMADFAPFWGVQVTSNMFDFLCDNVLIIEIAPRRVEQYVATTFHMESQ